MMVHDEWPGRHGGCIHRRKDRSCAKRDPDATTEEDHGMRNFDPTAPDRLWVMDVTQHPTGESKVQVAGVLDPWSRRVLMVDRRPHL
jgi:putative transposase